MPGDLPANPPFYDDFLLPDCSRLPLLSVHPFSGKRYISPEDFTVSDISGLRVCFRANSDIRLFTGTSTRSDGLKFKDLDHINDSSIIDGDSGEGGEAPDPDGGAGGNGEAPDPAA